jgi:hypothetical protein
LAGRLRPVFRGVYAVGHAALRREGWWMAALLACGEGSALGYGSASALWNLRARPILPLEVIVPGERGRKQAHYHSSKRARRRDHRRDRQLTALNWRPVRFTFDDIAFEPAGVARELAALLRS